MRTETDDSRPPAPEGEINAVPDLNVGDQVVVSAVFNHEPDRTLTVESTEADADPEGIHWNTDEGCTLSGYGTEYHLTTVEEVAGDRRRVYLVWPSMPEGVPVESIEIVERVDEESEVSEDR